MKQNDGVNVVLPSEKKLIEECAAKAEALCKPPVEGFTIEKARELCARYKQILENMLYDQGLDCQVVVSADDENYYEWDFTADGQPIWRMKPAVVVCHRVDKSQDTDYDKVRWEVRHGLVDGKVGRIIDGRTWSNDPDKTHLIK